jgi:hypothetical protein
MLNGFLFAFGFRGQFAQVLHHGIGINFPDGVDASFEFTFKLAFEFALEFSFGFELCFAFELALEFTLSFEFAFEFGFQFILGLVRHAGSSLLMFGAKIF